MKLTVCTVDGGAITVQNMEEDSVMAMVEAFSDEDQPVMTFALDDGMAYVNKRNISRIDLTDED